MRTQTCRNRARLFSFYCLSPPPRLRRNAGGTTVRPENGAQLQGPPSHKQSKRRESSARSGLPAPPPTPAPGIVRLNTRFCWWEIRNLETDRPAVSPVRPPFPPAAARSPETPPPSPRAALSAVLLCPRPVPQRGCFSHPDACGKPRCAAAVP